MQYSMQGVVSKSDYPVWDDKVQMTDVQLPDRWIDTRAAMHHKAHSLAHTTHLEPLSGYIFGSTSDLRNV